MAEDKQQWLRDNLPVSAGFVADVAAEFGRENVRVTYASENGHVLGKLVELDGVKLSETVVGTWARKVAK